MLPTRSSNSHARRLVFVAQSNLEPLCTRTTVFGLHKQQWVAVLSCSPKFLLLVYLAKNNKKSLIYRDNTTKLAAEISTKLVGGFEIDREEAAAALKMNAAMV